MMVNPDKDITLFGGYGFIGSEFFNKYPSIRLNRNDYLPPSKIILDFISTVHNYNIFENPYLDIETNLLTLIKTLEGCRLTWGKDFIFNFISSWFVYGDVELPAREFQECHPKGFYSITKKCAEDLLISYCNTYGISYRILRLANVLGTSDKKVSAKKNALQFLIQRLVNNESISLYYDGEFYRDFIDVLDCVDAIYLTITKGKLNTIYNIGNGIPLIFGDLISYVREISNSSSEIEKIDNVPFHSNVQVKSMYMSNKRLRDLGYQPQYSIKETLDKLVQYYGKE